MTTRTARRRPRILLADDHQSVLDGLRNLLEPEFEIVGTVQDGRSLLAAWGKLKPDITIVDISMPLVNGLEAVRQIRKRNTRAKLIMLTMHSDAAYVAESFRAGASAFVLKRALSSELIAAVREVLLGRAYLSSSIAEPTLRSFLEASADEQAVGELTPRQREVLRLVCEGHSSERIGEILNVSVQRVCFHKNRIKEQLGVRTTAELVRYAIRKKMVSPQRTSATPSVEPAR
jgi:DNA-binding NarL/FixJ family response regulator